MDDIIKTCRDFLENKYRALFCNSNFCFLDSLKKNNLQPVWIYAKTDNLSLLPKTDTDESKNGALLLDPEIGIMLYILPFQKDQDVSAQIARALELRAKLLPSNKNSGNGNFDPDGSWRVVLHWLVEERDVDDWLNKITKIRSQTLHLEEIPVDDIVNDKNNWRQAFERHGFPRLLFNTRSILRKKDLSDVYQWWSADSLVLEEFESFPSEFEDFEQTEIVEEIINQVRIYSNSIPKETQENNVDKKHLPKTLRSFRVKNFRNIKDLELKLGTEEVNALVLNGPNGTGKSNLFEALSLGIFKISNRYLLFLRDKDIATRDHAKQYLKSYLQPLNDPAEMKAELWINEEKTSFLPISEPIKVKKACYEMNGTLLSQETSQRFLHMKSEELGATVLKGYSTVADRLEYFVDENYHKANITRQNFLQNLRLSLNITNIPTAYDRISRNIIGLNLPLIPKSLVIWLESLADIKRDDYFYAKDLASRWKAWGDNDAMDSLVKEIISNKEEAEIKSLLFEWLDKYNKLLSETSDWISKFAQENLELIQKEADNLVNKIELWGEWLALRDKQPKTEISKEIEGFKKQLSELQKKQQQIVITGKKDKGRLDHFVQISRFINDDWSKNYPNECPTCGTDLTERKGIFVVFKELKLETEKKRNELIAQYKKITKSIDETQKKLVYYGQRQCPISAKDQSFIIESLQSLIPDSQIFSEYITHKEQRHQIIQKIDSLRILPDIPEEVNPEEDAERVAGIMSNEFKKADEAFNNPNNWKIVKNKLDKKLSNIVKKHLPDTLGKVWYELALNLTSAPWLLPTRKVNFHVKSTRRARGLSIKLGDYEDAPIARYILNHSEVHTLGLAWFFTRYLSYGRFKCAFVVMDDPAQEMDQTTYRDLCRLWETLVRLHKINKKSLSLLIMLHQEDRALNAARATGGMVNILTWKGIQDTKTLRKLKIIGEAFHPPRPDIKKLFA